MPDLDQNLGNPFQAATTDLSAPERERQPELPGMTLPLTGIPWLNMCFQPRRTIRKIVDTNPKQHVLLIISLSLTSLFFSPFLIELRNLIRNSLSLA